MRSCCAPTLAAEIGRSIDLKRKAATEALPTAGITRGVIESASLPR